MRFCSMTTRSAASTAGSKTSPASTWGSASYPTAKQEDNMTAWASAALPRSTRQIGAWIKQEFGLVYERYMKAARD